MAEQVPPPAQCLCGGVKLIFSAPPAAVINCFCKDCQKNTGATASHNLQFTPSQVNVVDPDGLVKRFTSPGRSGKSKDKVFCGKCGCTLFTDPSAFPDAIFVKTGVIDDGVSLFVPKAEIYVKDRPAYIPPQEGAAQAEVQQV